MPHLHFSSGSIIPEVKVVAALEAPSAISPTHENPDARLFLLDKEAFVIAYTSLWWKDVPSLHGQSVGAIGGFAAINAAAAKTILTASTEKLKEIGCHTAIGPMNGNTWRKHRFLIETDDRGPFLLEPRNPSDYPDWWQQAGFTALSHYSSSAMPLDGEETIPPTLLQRLERSGLVIQKIDLTNYDKELRAIHAVSLKSFAENFLYTPLVEEEFLSSYRKVRDRVDPDFVLIARKNSIPCGFAFGIPDLEAAARGEKPALIVKTLAVDPDARCPGLGSLLVEQLHHAAFAKGYTEAIHALQHESNSSLKITGRHQGHKFRRYALFSKLL